jgi:hypothetical protein
MTEKIYVLKVLFKNIFSDNHPERTNRTGRIFCILGVH